MVKVMNISCFLSVSISISLYLYVSLPPSPPPPQGFSLPCCQNVSLEIFVSSDDIKSQQRVSADISRYQLDIVASADKTFRETRRSLKKRMNVWPRSTKLFKLGFISSLKWKRLEHWDIKCLWKHGSSLHFWRYSEATQVFSHIFTFGHFWLYISCFQLWRFIMSGTSKVGNWWKRQSCENRLRFKPRAPWCSIQVLQPDLLEPLFRCKFKVKDKRPTDVSLLQVTILGFVWTKILSWFELKLR